MSLAITQQTGLYSNTPESKDDQIRKQNSALTDEFSNWMQKSPAEKIRAQYLAAHHLTEDQLAAMDPKERQKIEDDIKKTIKQQLGLDTDNKNQAQKAQNNATATDLKSKLAGLTLA